MKKYWNAGVNLFISSRQDDSFLRRGDSRDSVAKTKEISTTLLQNRKNLHRSTSSVHTSHRNGTEVIVETMEDIMLDELGD